MQAQETVSWVAVTATTDTYGNTSVVEAAAVDVEALVAPVNGQRSSVESVDANDPHTVTRWTLYLLDPTIQPGPSDWFTVRGARYEVDGQSFAWGSKGVELIVRRAA
jgi:hypothetical protein